MRQVRQQGDAVEVWKIRIERQGFGSGKARLHRGGEVDEKGLCVGCDVVPVQLWRGDQEGLVSGET